MYQGYIGKEFIMKRSTKVFVSSLISCCLLALNLPMTAMSIRADGEPSHQYKLEDIDPNVDECGWSLSDITEQEDPISLETDNYIFPGTFTLQFNATAELQKIAIRYDDFQTDVISVDATTTTDTWDLDHCAKINNIRIDNDELILELSSAYVVKAGSTFDVQINIFGEFNGNVELTDVGSEDQPWYEGERWFDAKPDTIVFDSLDYKYTDITINGTSHQDFQSTLGGKNEYSISSEFTSSGICNITVDGEFVDGLFDIRWHNCDAVERQGDYVPEEEWIEHGWAYIYKIYDNKDDMNDITSLYNLGNNGAVDDEGYGDIHIQSGNVIEFVFVPQYGYQLQAVQANGFPLNPQDEIPNHYRYEMPYTNIHFNAIFVAIPGQVQSTSQAVESGLLQLPSNPMDSGTGRITVSDVSVDYTNQITSEIGEGYEIADEFNIDLNTIYHKANRGNDYWEMEEDIHDPNGTATVALTLDESFTVPEDRQVQVIHDTGNGLETVNTTYNPQTRTLTFNTTGFSNFIITTTSEPVDEAVVSDGFYDQTMPDDPWGENNQDDPNEPGGQHPVYQIVAEGSGFALRRGYDPDNTEDPTEFDLRVGDLIEDDAEIIFDRSVEGTDVNFVIDGQDSFIYPGDGDVFASGFWMQFDGITLPTEEGDPVTVNLTRVAPPQDENPHFFIGQDGNGYGLGGEYWDENDELVFEPFEAGESIPDDATINLSNEFRGTDTVVMISVDGNIVYVLSADEIDRGFVPGHWLRYDGVTEDNNGITVNFTTIWVIQIAGQTGFELTVVDEDGDPMIPNYAPDDFEYPFVTDFGFDEYGEPYTLTFEEMPYMAIVRAHNAVFTMLLDEDYEFIPYGDNEILYPADDDCGFAFIWFDGMPYIDADCIRDVAFDIDGLGEDDESMYAVTIREFDVTDLSEEEFAQFSDMAATGDYTDATPLLGLEIDLFKDGENEPIHDPGFTFTITLTLAEAIDLEDGESVFLIHMLEDGSFEIIEATYDADEMTLTFETSSFSPFVICKGANGESSDGTATDTTTPTPATTPATTPASTPDVASENAPAAKGDGTTTTPTPTPASTSAPSTGEKQHSIAATIGMIMMISAAAIAIYNRRTHEIVED